MSTRPIRVRIAPSPTGDPHVGTAYVALFNYVFAKRYGGEFILRIEDTDRTRYRQTSEEQITKCLRWLGLSWKEGPDVGGPNGPYRQSERTPIYQEHAKLLVEKGRAYPCFCDAGRLDKVRQDRRAAGLNTGYDGFCKGIPVSEARNRMASGEAYVIRMAIPQDGETRFVDRLRGEIVIRNDQIDDQVLLKSDGFPTYHLANVVDDRLMGISHVIRAEEWISSTPKHVRLYEAFGWDQPEWIHLPLLRNPDRSKISKRKNPVSLEFYRRAGYLPEALRNFLALMGWNFGNDIEKFSLDQMIEKFNIDDINLGGPIFDLVKLRSINKSYLHELSPSDFVAHLRNDFLSEKYLLQLHPLLAERMETFADFVDRGSFFFNGELDYSQADYLPKSRDPAEVRNMLVNLVEQLDELYDWNAEKLAALLENHRGALGWKPKDYFMTVRLIVTGRKDSPPLNESLALIGREMVRFRIRQFIDAKLSTS